VYSEMDLEFYCSYAKKQYYDFFWLTLHIVLSGAKSAQTIVTKNPSEKIETKYVRNKKYVTNHNCHILLTSNVS